MTLNSLSLTGEQRMKYETPEAGITLTGYIARRMHKTRLLEGIEMAIQNDARTALAQFGLYAIAAGTSFGPALYQPRFDRPGSRVVEEDPDTGATITVVQESRSPYFEFRGSAIMPDGSSVELKEHITGTKVGLRGLGMPAPSTYVFTSGNSSYRAEAFGVIHSELAPGLGRWKVRGYGELTLQDNEGNQGVLRLNRKGFVIIEVESQDGGTISRKVQLNSSNKSANLFNRR